MIAVPAIEPPVVTPKPQPFVDHDCSDFDTQSEAQHFFKAEGLGPTVLIRTTMVWPASHNHSDDVPVYRSELCVKIQRLKHTTAPEHD